MRGERRGERRGEGEGEEGIIEWYRRGGKS